MTFRDPLWLLALLVPLGWLWWDRRRRRAGLRFPSVEGLGDVASGARRGWHRLPPLLRAVALALIVLALARPQQGLEESHLTTEGIDIVLAVDVSTSMLAEDFQLRGERRNRLDVVKEVIKEFVAHRPNDRIGLVVFAGRAYTQAPLTLDHGWLLTTLQQVKIGAIEDGTAIGSGMATALNRLRNSTAKSRVMVLLTDGVNNAGSVTPEVAAQLASTLGVKIYAIGAGTRGLAPYPMTDLFGRRVYEPVEIPVDDEGLTRIAQTTGGQYFRATDTESLRTIYQQIDQLEKTVIEQPKFMVYKEWYGWLVASAIGLLLVEMILGQTRLRVLP